LGVASQKANDPVLSGNQVSHITPINASEIFHNWVNKLLDNAEYSWVRTYVNGIGTYQ